MQKDEIIRNQNLGHRVMVDKMFSHEECREIIRLADDYPESPAMLEGEIKNSYIRETKVRHFDFNPQNRWIWDRIFRSISQANEKYFRFKLFSFPELQFLEYEEGGFFDWHVDITADALSCTRKLSVIVFLSDPEDYDGGQLTWDMVPALKLKNARMEQGSMIIFPSFQVHKVEPVTRGKRFTLAGWAHGNSFS
jgi:PKHD-type hydroxylase